MNIVLDIITVAVFILTVFFAYKRGFISAIIHFIGFFIAYLLAFVVSNPVGQALDSSFMNNIVSGVVSGSVKSGGSDFFTKILDGIPSTVGDSLSGISDTLGTESEKALSGVVSAISAPVSSMMSRCIAFIVVFIIALVAIKIIEHFSRLLKHVPVIGTLNALLGAIVGVFEAVLIMFLISTLVSISVSFASFDKKPWVTNENIQSTLVYKYIDNINPLTQMLLRK